MIDGSVTVGPNAVLAFKREGYRKRDFSFSDTLEILGSSGIRRVLQNHLRSGLGEIKTRCAKRLSAAGAKVLSPAFVKRSPALAPGVRAQAVSPDGKLIDDFLFVTTRARSTPVMRPPRQRHQQFLLVRILSARYKRCWQARVTRTHAASGT